MDLATVGAIFTGARTGLEAIKQVADTVSAIKTAAKGPEGNKTAEVGVKELDSLTEKLIEAKVRTIDIVSVAEQLQSENIALRDTLARKEAFSERSKQYRLSVHKDGAVTYEFVPHPNDITPPHSVCPNCFENEKIRALQPDNVDFGTTRMKCGECGLQVPLPNNRKSGSWNGRAQTDWSPFSE